MREFFLFFVRPVLPLRKNERSLNLTAKMTPIQKNKTKLITTKRSSDWNPYENIKPRHLPYLSTQSLFFFFIQIPPQNRKMQVFHKTVFTLKGRYKSTSSNIDLPSLSQAPNEIQQRLKKNLAYWQSHDKWSRSSPCLRQRMYHYKNTKEKCLWQDPRY